MVHEMHGIEILIMVTGTREVGTITPQQPPGLTLTHRSPKACIMSEYGTRWDNAEGVDDQAVRA